jgi:hypothetical protein
MAMVLAVMEFPRKVGGLIDDAQIWMIGTRWKAFVEVTRIA